MTSISLPSTGSPRSRFSCFIGTMKMCDVLHPSRRASFPSLGDTMRCGLRFAPCGSGRPTAGQGFVIRSPLPDRSTHGGVQDLPGSWGTLVFLCRVLRPRQDRRIRRLDVVGVAPAMSTTKAPTITVISGLNSTALELAVYASCGRLPGQHATLASGCWPACRAGLVYPQGSMKGFSAVSLHRFPLSQALPGARTFSVLFRRPALPPVPAGLFSSVLGPTCWALSGRVHGSLLFVADPRALPWAFLLQLFRLATIPLASRPSFKCRQSAHREHRGARGVKCRHIGYVARVMATSSSTASASGSSRDLFPGARPAPGPSRSAAP